MEVKFTQCPYREICKCPGYDEDDGEWEPIEGFILKEEGLVCLDWNITIPVEKLRTIRLTEGRHIVDAGLAADKLDDAKRRYNRSEKRREAQVRYAKSEKGRAVWARFTKGEKFRLSIQKYNQTPKGQATIRRRSNKVKDFRKIAKWLKANPGRSPEDYTQEDT